VIARGIELFSQRNVPGGFLVDIKLNQTQSLENNIHQVLCFSVDETPRGEELDGLPAGKVKSQGSFPPPTNTSKAATELII